MQGQEVSSGTVDPCTGESWHGKCCGKSILSVGRTCLPVVHIRTDIALLRRGADGAWVAMPMPVMTYMCSTIDAVKCKSGTRSLHIYSQLPISTENVLRLEGGSCVLGLQALAHPDATQLAFAIAVDAFVLARSASCPEHVKAWPGFFGVCTVRQRNQEASWPNMACIVLARLTARRTDIGHVRNGGAVPACGLALAALALTANAFGPIPIEVAMFLLATAQRFHCGAWVCLTSTWAGHWAMVLPAWLQWGTCQLAWTT